jgi:FAD/FMN-containing dehydrogenase
MLLWPWERAAEVLDTWRTWTADAPETITTSARILQLPPAPEMPDFLRGRAFVAIDGAFLGSDGEARELLAPLRALGPEIDTFGPSPVAALSRVHMDPEHPVPGTGDHLLIDDLSPAAINAFVATAGCGSGSPLLAAELRHLGGAVGRPDPLGGALSHIEGAYAMFAVGVTPNAAARAAVAGHLGSLRTAMTSYATRREYANFVEEQRDPSTFFAPDVVERLRRVKDQYDPENVFRANHQLV